MPGGRASQLAVFQGLAHHFQHLALELGQLVQEEDDVVGEADLAGLGDRAAADEARIGDGAVQGAEGVGKEGLAPSTPQTSPRRVRHAAHRSQEANCPIS
jgi:hypothetical protein